MKALLMFLIIRFFNLLSLKNFSSKILCGLGIIILFVFITLFLCFFPCVIIFHTHLIEKILLGFVIILRFYLFKKSSPFVFLEVFKNYYQTSFRQLHSVLFHCFPVYYRICDFLLGYFPDGEKSRVIAIFIFNILPFSFLNIVIFKQLCLGYFNLQFLLLLIPVQFFNIWIFTSKFFFEAGYSELMPLYRKMISIPDSLPLYIFVYECGKEYFLEALQNAYKIEEIHPLFNGMTPKEYGDRCYYIGENLNDLLGFQNLVNLINRYCYLFTFILSLMILILSLEESLSSSFVSYSFSFLNHLAESII